MKKKIIILITLNMIISTCSIIRVNANPQVRSIEESSIENNTDLVENSIKGSSIEMEDIPSSVENESIESEDLNNTGTSLITENLTENELEMTKNMSSTEFTELIQMYDSRIQSNIEKLEELDKSIVKKEDELEKNKNTIKILEKELETKTGLLDDRVRNIHINGGFEKSNLYLLDALISANSLSDFVSKFKFVSRSIQYDKNLINEVQRTKEEIENIQKDINKSYKELQGAKALVEKENSKIQEDKSKVLSLLVASNTLNNTLNSNITFSTELLSDVSGTAKSVIEEASKYLGIPYVWGGTTPSGFDCSGLMQYCFGKFGVNLPRVSEDQQNAGIKVPLSQIKAGDMVFFGYPAHHVGLYIGNGQYLHAPHTGDVVKISQLDTSKVTSVGRVIL